MNNHRSVHYFEDQFQRQVEAREFQLNPFEILALEHLRGTVLDLGCGLGNLAIEAAARGHRVVAIDASPTAIRRIRAEVSARRLDLSCVESDLTPDAIDGIYDTVVSIGLLMFFRRDCAYELLGRIRDAVSPGGVVVLNVLVEGTTFRAIFDPDDHHLFALDELHRFFEGWKILVERSDSFPAPGDTRKEFVTLIAERPS